MKSYPNERMAGPSTLEPKHWHLHYIESPIGKPAHMHAPASFTRPNNLPSINL